MRSKKFMGVIVAALAIIMASLGAMAQTKKSSTTAGSASPTFYLTEEGIDGVIKLGESYENIPQKVDGLYEVLKIEEEGAGEYYVAFCSKKGATYFYATTDGDGNVKSIWIGKCKALKAKVNDQIIPFDGTYSSLSKFKGAEKGIDPTGHFPVTFIGKIEFVQENDWEEGPKDKISQVILRK